MKNATYINNNKYIHQVFVLNLSLLIYGFFYCFRRDFNQLEQKTKKYNWNFEVKWE